MSSASAADDMKFMDRNSRQIGTFGLDTMLKLMSIKVIIVGCNGIGAEAAKNLALAGVHTITLVDPKVPTVADLGVNFALNEKNISSGRSRASLTADLVAELNPLVRVSAAEGDTTLDEELVRLHDVMIVTSGAPSLAKAELVRWNHFCRSNLGEGGVPKPISFILALQGGVAGSIFVDHGANFVVKDSDGRPPLQKAIQEVKELVDKKGRRYTRVRFITPEGMTPGSIGDYSDVRITDAKGFAPSSNAVPAIEAAVFHSMTAKNDPRDTVRIYPSLAEQGYGAWENGGFLHQVKTAELLQFRSLQEALEKPGQFVMVSPMMDFAQENAVHLWNNALLEYADRHAGLVPALGDDAAAAEFVEIAKSLNAHFAAEKQREEVATAAAEKKADVEDDPTDEAPAKLPPPPPPTFNAIDDVDVEFFRRSALIAEAQLQPLAAFFGAVVAQEVVKITGKYMPINQFLNMHWDEVLPERTQDAVAAGEFSPTGSRYDNLIAIFGKSFAARLQALRLFMVGCGALGCENIKNFALCGISCGANGALVVTDNDRIEVSNLNRQFLFREDNVGQPKSVAARARASAMNPLIRIEALQEFVGPATEHVFNDDFWMSLDGVVNALDNMAARLYVDDKCVLHEKVLVEAGTMGTAGNIDIIVPRKTTSYSDGGNADETGGIPMCTLRNFPYIFDHCIEWARAIFTDLFVSPIQMAQQLMEDPATFASKIRSDIATKSKDGGAGLKRSLTEKALVNLKQLKSTVDTLASRPTIEACVQLAWDQFHALFRHKIKSLILAFPPDAKKSNGEPFWSGHRKFPKVVGFDAEAIAKNPDIANFLIAAANLFACALGLHPTKHEPRLNDPSNRWMSQFRSTEWLMSIVSKLPEPAFKREAVEGLDDDLKTAASNGAGGEQSDEGVQAEFDGILDRLVTTAAGIRGAAAVPLDFEKDDDDNFHIDFVTAAANLRAINYEIATADRLKVKLVAGKIIPAIATTTAAVTGLALLEFFKVLQDKPVSTLRNGMIDLGSNNYTLFDRDPPKAMRTVIESQYLPEKDYTYRTKIIREPNPFTKYDKIRVEVTKTTTTMQFCDLLLEKINSGRAPDQPQYEVMALGSGTGTLFNGVPKHKNAQIPILDVLEEQMISEGRCKERGTFWAKRKIFTDITVNLDIADEDLDNMAVDAIDIQIPTVMLIVTDN